MKRPSLSRERVLDAAIAFADEHGIEALSMRKLGQALGVEAMSLYNHVANKADLVDAIVERVVEEIELPETGDWEGDLRTCAHSAHEAFTRHPWAVSLVMSPGSAIDASARLSYIEWILRRLRESGFSAELAYDAYHALDSHIIGFTYWQLGHATSAGDDMEERATAFFRDRGDQFPYLIEHARQHFAAEPGEGKREFEFGLDLILDGLKRLMGAGGFEPP